MVLFDRGKKAHEAIVLNALPKSLRGRIEKGRDVAFVRGRDPGVTVSFIIIDERFGDLSDS